MTAMTTGAANVTNIVLVARRRALHRWPWDWAVHVAARSVYWTLDRACGAAGHFLWLHDRDDPEHRWACWIVGGPRGVGRRGKLWWWSIDHARPCRYEFVAPETSNAGTACWPLREPDA